MVVPCGRHYGLVEKDEEEKELSGRVGEQRSEVYQLTKWRDGDIAVRCSVLPTKNQSIAIGRSESLSGNWHFPHLTKGIRHVRGAGGDPHHRTRKQTDDIPERLQRRQVRQWSLQALGNCQRFYGLRVANQGKSCTFDCNRMFETLRNNLMAFLKLPRFFIHPSRFRSGRQLRQLTAGLEV